LFDALFDALRPAHTCASYLHGQLAGYPGHNLCHKLLLLLQSNEPQNSEVLKVELAGIQSMLGIEAGGPDALVALSLLCGGDYAVKGAEHVGSRQAFRLVHHLLQGCQVLSRFDSACSHACPT